MDKGKLKFVNICGWVFVGLAYVFALFDMWLLFNQVFRSLVFQLIFMVAVYVVSLSAMICVLLFENIIIKSELRKIGADVTFCEMQNSYLMRHLQRFVYEPIKDKSKSVRTKSKVRK